MKPVHISPAAISDLLLIAEFLEGESDDAFLGDRFLTAVASTVDTIERFPLIGRQRPTHQAKLVPLHSIGIDRPFGNYLIFYQPLIPTTLILRILHGGRDFGPILDIDSERDA